MASENLYVIKRTFTDPKTPDSKIALPATFTDLKAAKAEAKTILTKEGYETEFFPVYDVNDGHSQWKHGDGVIVYAEGPESEIIKVEIVTVGNVNGLKADGTGRVQSPLHYVLQTIIHYDEDRSGSKRDSLVEGVYKRKEEAVAYSLKVLLDEDVTKEDFAEYDEYSDSSDQPFGSDVMVHAVKSNGENILVSVVSDSNA
jgi:hypothetical protein